MLKQLILENWKSFRYAELPLDPLTVLIGTNASGKSNVVEALEFLQRIAQGENIEAALAGDKRLPSIRGGVEWAALKPGKEFTLRVVVSGEDEKTDYSYTIKLQTEPSIWIDEEYITLYEFQDNNPIKSIDLHLHKYNSNINRSNLSTYDTDDLTIPQKYVKEYMEILADPESREPVQ
jgi:AAA15 family ATPase/GTPase